MRLRLYKLEVPAHRYGDAVEYGRRRVSPAILSAASHSCTRQLSLGCDGIRQLASRCRSRSRSRVIPAGLASVPNGIGDVALDRCYQEFTAPSILADSEGKQSLASAPTIESRIAVTV